METTPEARAEAAQIELALRAQKAWTVAAWVSHPAWHWLGSQGRLESSAVQPSACEWVHVRLGAAEVVLGLPAQAACPMLQRFFAERNSVPEALRLAAVERDCAALLDALAQLVGAAVEVLSLADPPSAEVPLWWGRWSDLATGEAVVCGIGLPAAFAERMAAVGHWEVTHPTLAQEPLEVQVVLAQVWLTAEEVANLTAGDALCLPEWSAAEEERGAMAQLGAVAQRPVGLTAEGRLEARGPWVAVPEEVASMVQVVWGLPVAVSVERILAWGRGEGDLGVRWSQVEPIALVKGGRRLAWGRLDRLGEQFIVAIDGVEG